MATSLIVQRQQPLSLKVEDIPGSLEEIPSKTGVYIFRNVRGEPLYVGKAKNLRRRLGAYFQAEVSLKIRNLLQRATTLEIILTRNEKEALILEARLIKRYRPRYNVVLRDDKNYPLLRLTIREKFPRLQIVRRRKKDGNLYFGPYPSAKSVRETLRFLGSIFPLRRCSNAEFSRRLRPCLEYQIGRCRAPCVGLIGEDEYRTLVDQVIHFLRGQKRAVLERLRQEMFDAAEKLEFERAAFLRDRIQAIERTLESQTIICPDEINRDVIGLAQEDGWTAIVVVFVRAGELVGQKGFHFSRTKEDPPELLASFIKQFYDEGKVIPEEVVLPVLPNDAELLSQWLKEMAGYQVRLLTPQSGPRIEILRLAQTNAIELLKRKKFREEAWENIAQELAGRLRLPHPPRRVECIDISNIQAEAPVGSLVSFFDGEPDKSSYRHYHLQSPGPNDYAMMAEVLERRFKKDKSDLPDLLVVDGGKGQLNVALTVLKELGLEDQITLCALAKERAGEGEKIYLPYRKNPLLLPKHNPALLFLMKVRDEAHRFGVNFHRRVRNKKALSSLLEEIPGIGPRRRARLLEYFGSLEAIAQADPAEIAKVPGMTRTLAERVDEYLKARYGLRDENSP